MDGSVLSELSTSHPSSNLKLLVLFVAIQIAVDWFLVFVPCSGIIIVVLHLIRPPNIYDRDVFALKDYVNIVLNRLRAYDHLANHCRGQTHAFRPRALNRPLNI